MMQKQKRWLVLGVMLLCFVGVLFVVGCGNTATVPDGDTGGVLGSSTSEITTTEAPTVYLIELMVEGEVVDTLYIKHGEYIGAPAAPEREDHIFKGWFWDEACTETLDPLTPIYGSGRIWGAYTMDAASLTNEITTDVIRSLVQVRVECYNSFFGMRYDSVYSTGSGVIFHVNADTYYLLTNCHVAVKQSDRSHVEYTIVDYAGNESIGTLYHGADKKVDAIDAGYDLACLWFESSNDSLRAIDLAEGDPTSGQNVISLGYPAGQSNAITFGKVLEYTNITLKNCEPYESNVTFPVAQHSALIDGGSSGGPLLNSKLELVGINYAGNITDEDFHNGYAIPLSKVREFLNKYVYSS